MVLCLHMVASYNIIPVMVEFKGGPLPSLFVPNTVIAVFDDEEQLMER